MASTKSKAANVGVHTPVAKSRTSSYTRVKSPLRSADPHAPSTLPPPPFESEVEVPGLEWWLGAHVGLASELLWLEQLLDTIPEGRAHVETMQRLVAHVEAVRDALYELYCDAADDRVAPLIGQQPGAILEERVRLSYAWCTSVVGVLATVANGLRARGDEGPDWAAAKAAFRHAETLHRAPSSELRDAVRLLRIDFTSPIEPLRNLPHDLDQLFASVEELHTALAKRFG
jgi:hypothetical protein